MKYKVEALNTYEIRQIRDEELNRIPKEGEEWLVDKDRLDTLLGNNKHNIQFVRLIEEIKEEKPASQSRKSTTTKGQSRKRNAKK